MLNPYHSVLGPIEQAVVSLTADHSIAALSYTFVKIDPEIVSMYSHSSPSADSRRVVVSYKPKYVHEVLVNRLVKLAQEKVWLGELTVST